MGTVDRLIGPWRNLLIHSCDALMFLLKKYCEVENNWGPNHSSFERFVVSCSNICFSMWLWQRLQHLGGKFIRADGQPRERPIPWPFTTCNLPVFCSCQGSWLALPLLLLTCSQQAPVRTHPQQHTVSLWVPEVSRKKLKEVADSWEDGWEAGTEVAAITCCKVSVRVLIPLFASENYRWDQGSIFLI